MRFALAQLRSTIDPRENLALVTDAASRAAVGGSLRAKMITIRVPAPASCAG